MEGGEEREWERNILEIVFRSAHKALPITYLDEFTMPNVLALTVLQAVLKAWHVLWQSSKCW